MIKELDHQIWGELLALYIFLHGVTLGLTPRECFRLRSSEVQLIRGTQTSVHHILFILFSRFSTFYYFRCIKLNRYPSVSLSKILSNCTSLYHFVFSPSWCGTSRTPDGNFRQNVSAQLSLKKEFKSRKNPTSAR